MIKRICFISDLKNIFFTQRRKEGIKNERWMDSGLGVFFFFAFLHETVAGFFKTDRIRWVAIIGSCLIFGGCENDEKVLKEWNEKKIMVEEAKDITSLYSQQGKLKAKLTAPLMLRYNADTTYTEFPKSLHVNFYNDSLQVESQLNALYGKYFESLNKVFLRDSVVVFNIAGDTLRSPELWWDQNQKKFYTDKLVRIQTKDKHIYGGKGLEAGQDFSWYIIKQTTGSYLVPNDMVPQ